MNPPSNPGIGYRFLDVGESLFVGDEVFERPDGWVSLDKRGWSHSKLAGMTVGSHNGDAWPQGWYRRKVVAVIPSGWELRPDKSLISKDDKFWTGITWQECGKNLDGVCCGGGGLIVVRPRIAATKNYSPNAPGYRAILCGEILGKNDEYCPIGSIEWRKVEACVGEPIEKSDEGFFRRKVVTLPSVPKVIEKAVDIASLPMGNHETKFRRSLTMPDIHVSYAASKECPFDSGTNDPLMTPNPFKIICVNEEHRKFVLKFLLSRGYRFHIYGNNLDAEKYSETFPFLMYPIVAHFFGPCASGEISVSDGKENDPTQRPLGPEIHLHEVQTYLPPEPVVKLGDVYKDFRGTLLLVGYSIIASLDNGDIRYTHETIKSLKSLIRMGNATLVKRGVKVSV